MWYRIMGNSGSISLICLSPCRVGQLWCPSCPWVLKLWEDVHPIPMDNTEVFTFNNDKIKSRTPTNCSSQLIPVFSPLQCLEIYFGILLDINFN